MTLEEAAHKHLSRISVNNKFSWTSTWYIGHLFAASQRLYPELPTNEHTAVVGIALWIIEHGKWRDSGLLSNVYIYSSSALAEIKKRGLSAAAFDKIFNIVKNDCYYYAHCCDNLLDNQLWKEFDEYKLGQYFGEDSNSVSR